MTHKAALILTILVGLGLIVGVTLLIPQPFSMMISMLIGFFAGPFYRILRGEE